MLQRVYLTRVVLVSFLALAVCALPAADTVEATAPAGKTIRLLKIGNSFSQNATEFLPQLAKSQGHTVVLGRAEIGGCSLEKHWTLAEKNEADANDPLGKPYTLVAADGKKSRASLKDWLRSEPWDVVTIQQQSLSAMDPQTYQPFANKLAEYIRKHAPQAKIYVHETWAYRTDNPLIVKQKKTPDAMYADLHAAYQAIAREIQAHQIIPTGTAFQLARNDERWKSDDENTLVDAKTLKYPELPTQKRALCMGYRWDTKSKTPKLLYDGKHATTAGKYLGAAVWCETLFGPITQNAFVPKGLPTEDATVLREIAAKAARKE